jgi:tRNA A37 methylthiotransferase MiaB
VHVFPFSARPGTAAAELGSPVPPEVVRDRRARLSELAHDLGNEFRCGLAGARERVVLEGWAGLSGRYQRVRVRPEEVRGAPPAAIDVTLEARRRERPGAPGKSDWELLGRPLGAVVAG